MRILELKVNYEPENAAGVMLDANTAEDIARAGNEVLLYCPSPSRGVLDEIASSTPSYEEKIGGNLKIHRYKMPKEKGSLVRRTLRYCLCCAKQIVESSKLSDIDVIFTGSTPPFQGLVAKKLKRKFGASFVLNLQDIFPESLVAAGISNEKSVIYKLGLKMSQSIYNSADEIIVPSIEMKENLVKKRIDKDKIHVVLNWIDEKIVYPIQSEENALKNELNIPSYNFTIVYAGNLGLLQGIGTIVKCAEILKNNKDIGFIIFGNGSEENTICKRIEEKKLNNVHMYALQPYERVAEVYSIGDACIVSCKKNTGNNAMPSKTWSIMGCGRAVLASFDEDTLLKEIVVNNKCGLFSKAEDADALAQNIIYLSKHKSLCNELGNNGRKFVEENLTRSKATSKICKIIEKSRYNQ